MAPINISPATRVLFCPFLTSRRYVDAITRLTEVCLPRGSQRLVGGSWLGRKLFIFCRELMNCPFLAGAGDPRKFVRVARVSTISYCIPQG